MSKSCRTFKAILSALLVGVLSSVYSQELSVSLKIDAGAPSTAVIEGAFRSKGPHRELRFLTDYGSASKLNERISGLRLFAADGSQVMPHEAGPGRYIAESDIVSFAYRVDLTPRHDLFSAAHISWANNDGAILSLDDLLPEDQFTADISFQLPEGWTIVNTGQPRGTRFKVTDIERAVLHAGRGMRTAVLKVPDGDVTVTVVGEWRFTDEDASEMAGSLFKEYAALFGGRPSGPLNITLRPFPKTLSMGQWEASSRGKNVTIVSSDMPFKSQSLQRLHEQLRHELFHLWVPNSLNLSGNYDWFYEGFALYQSLKVGIAVNRIRFEDFLDTLSRAYQIASTMTTKGSLIEASANRWRGSNTEVYTRGMLVAFACDLALLKSSGGKRSISEVLKRLYKLHGHESPARNGNDAIMDILRSFPELRQAAEHIIAGSEGADLRNLLGPAGLELDDRSNAARIKVVNSPSGRQKELLDRLGYNNWRNLPKSR